MTFLRDAEAGEAPRLGRRVVDLWRRQYGDGCGAHGHVALAPHEALIIYRRDRAHMPAHAFEADEAIEEGIKIKWLTSIKEIAGPTLTVERMTLDAVARPQPTGEIETLEADAVVLALGQETDSAFLKRVPGIEFKPDGTVIVGPDMMTGHAGIFAGGDMVPERAHRHRRRRPRQARSPQHRCMAHRQGLMPNRARAPLVSFDMLNLPVFSDADPAREKELAICRAG